ncbi:hypothetical protein [Thermocladium modestius]|uniref:hypothetical protein n=1 Tax=Thermocladium modestius TaxID=62609 RepID=UPI001669E6D0|nr:hypothetical protein [Thermocladium modestius]
MKIKINRNARFFILGKDEIEILIDDGINASRIVLEDDERKGVLSDAVRRIIEWAPDQYDEAVRGISSSFGLREDEARELIDSMIRYNIIEAVSSDGSGAGQYDGLMDSIRRAGAVGNDGGRAVVSILDLMGGESMRDLRRAMELLGRDGFVHRYLSPDEVGRVGEGSGREAVVMLGGLNHLRGMVRLTRQVIDRGGVFIIYIVIGGNEVFLFDTIPRRTGCVEDFLGQLVIGGSEELRFAGGDGLDVASPMHLNNALLFMALGFAVYDALHLLNTGEGLLTAKVLSINSVTLNMRLSKLLRSPFCGTCGSGHALMESVVREGVGSGEDKDD